MFDESLEALQISWLFWELAGFWVVVKFREEYCEIKIFCCICVWNLILNFLSVSPPSIPGMSQTVTRTDFLSYSFPPRHNPSCVESSLPCNPARQESFLQIPIIITSRRFCLRWFAFYLCVQIIFRETFLIIGSLLSVISAAAAVALIRKWSSVCLSKSSHSFLARFFSNWRLESSWSSELNYVRSRWRKRRRRGGTLQQRRNGLVISSSWWWKSVYPSVCLSVCRRRRRKATTALFCFFVNEKKGRKERERERELAYLLLL